MVARPSETMERSKNLAGIGDGNTPHRRQYVRMGRRSELNAPRDRILENCTETIAHHLARIESGTLVSRSIFKDSHRARGPSLLRQSSGGTNSYQRDVPVTGDDEGIAKTMAPHGRAGCQDADTIYTERRQRMGRRALSTLGQRRLDVEPASCCDVGGALGTTHYRALCDGEQLALRPIQLRNVLAGRRGNKWISASLAWREQLHEPTVVPPRASCAEIRGRGSSSYRSYSDVARRNVVSTITDIGDGHHHPPVVSRFVPTRMAGKFRSNRAAQLERGDFPRSGPPSFTIREHNKLKLKNIFDNLPIQITGASIPPKVLPHEFTSTQLNKRRSIKQTYNLLPITKATTVPWATSIRARFATQLSNETHGKTALDFLTSGLAKTTVSSYDGKIKKFVDFCMEHNYAFLPASQFTILNYIGYLAEEGSVSVDNVQPYLSAINTMHTQLALDAPASGDIIAQARKGWRQRQTTNGAPRDHRIPLPASEMKRILSSAVSMCRTGRYVSCFSLFRDHVALIIIYLFFGRSDTGHGVGFHGDNNEADLQIHGSTLVFYEYRRKGHTQDSKKRTLVWDCATHMEVLNIFETFNKQRNIENFTTEYYWQLRSDKGNWHASVIDDMLQRVLTELHIAAPPGFNYSAHSLRSGAASAAHSVRVPIITICHFGGWAQGSAAVHSYIDPSWRRTAEAEFFFNWLT